MNPYRRSNGEVVRGHKKNVNVSSRDVVATPKNSGVADAVNELSREFEGGLGASPYGWSTMQWGAVATGPSHGSNFLTDSYSSTWDITKGEGYVLDADGARVWLGPGVNLKDVTLVGVAAPGVNLRGGNFQGVVFEGVNFEGGNFEGVSFQGVEANGCDFSGGNFSQSIINHTSFENSVFTGSSFDGAGCGATQFTDCDLRDVKADRAQFVRSQMESVSAENSSWVEAGMSDVAIRLSHFDGSHWEGVDVENTRVTASSLRGVRASGAKFSRFVVYSTDMRSMDFTAATAENFDMNRSCRYEAVPAGYAPLHLLESGRLEGRSNSDNDKLPVVFDWENRNDYHVPLWSYQMNGLL